MSYTALDRRVRSNRIVTSHFLAVIEDSRYKRLDGLEDLAMAVHKK